jgi:hypothetical protein
MQKNKKEERERLPCVEHSSSGLYYEPGLKFLRPERLPAATWWAFSPGS